MIRSKNFQTHTKPTVVSFYTGQCTNKNQKLRPKQNPAINKHCIEYLKTIVLVRAQNMLPYYVLVPSNKT